MIDRIPKDLVRVHVLSEKPSHCTRCDGYLSRHTINVDEYSDNDSVYYECSKCARKYTTPDQYCKNSKCFICINKDEAQSLIDEFKDQRERIITLVSKVVACLKSEGISIPGLINRIHAMNFQYAVSVFELVLLKKPDGNYMFVLLSSEPRINQKERSFKIWGYLLVEGRRLLLEVNKRGDLFYYDGYNYEVVRVEVINHELHDNVLNMLKERSTFGSDKKSYIDDNSLPDEEKVVYVYQRLNNACSKHNVETVTAQTYNVKNGCPVEINIFHCLDCDKYYVNFEAMRGYIDKGVYPALNYYLVDNGLGNLNSISKLRMFGYNVRQDDLSEGERRRILSYLIDTGIMSKHEIINDLQFFVSYNGKKNGNELARRKWLDDIQYVSKYVKSNNKKIKAKFVYPKGSFLGEDRSSSIKTTQVSLHNSAQLPKVNNEVKVRRLFPVGSIVRHERYGEGLVIGYEDKSILIDFDGIGLKKLMNKQCIDDGMLKRG